LGIGIGRFKRVEGKGAMLPPEFGPLTNFSSGYLAPLEYKKTFSRPKWVLISPWSCELL